MRLGTCARLLPVAISLAAIPALAQDPARLPRDSIVSLVSTGTGMSKDAASLALGDSPAALKKATDYLTAIKVISLAASARDEDAMSQTVDWALGKVADAALKETAAGTVLTGVMLYKTTLEVTRDMIVYPRMDAETYRIYKQQRGQNPTDEIERGLAFHSATSGAGSYFSLKRRMYDDLVRSKGWKKELLGGKLDTLIYNGIDAYWEARLEARWKKEWVTEHRDSLLADLSAKQKKALNDTRVAARPTTPTPVAQPVALPKPATKPAGATAQDSAIVAAFIAGENAHVQWLTDYQHKAGWPEFQHRLKWLVPPHIENGVMVWASLIEQKVNAEHEWTGLSSAGDAQNPMRTPLGSVRPWKP